MQRLQKLVLGVFAALTLMVAIPAAPAHAEPEFQCNAPSCLVTQCWEFWCFWGG